ncbi:hypothetical protein SASPL_108956 [Salvia splendens]|uniref:Uncharacterized protein n=1 Tax=Salvia splendens TaxID=180675 RepID=A0A8X8YE19_SALSN|nr:hypothetical protein SASPL_108956 [Salvia splendens]
MVGTPRRSDDSAELRQKKFKLEEVEVDGDGADAKEDGEEWPPVAAPVRSSRWQAITGPNNFSRSHSTTEADHPDMGRCMVRGDAIWPHLRKTGEEAAPPVPTEEGIEDLHLMWEWACGEDEDNPILVYSDEEQGPKRERPQDCDSEDVRDCGYYTPSGKWVW